MKNYLYLALVLAISTIGCSNYSDKPSRVSIYSNSVKVKEYISEGHVGTRDKYDTGYTFIERDTKKIITVSGTVMIEEL